MMRADSSTMRTSGVFCAGQFLLQQGNDFFAPHLQRRLASVPLEEAADPFVEEDAVFAEAVGHGDGAAVGLAVSVLAEETQYAGADFFKRGGFAQDAAKPGLVRAGTAGGHDQDFAAGGCRAAADNLAIRRGCFAFDGSGGGHDGRVRHPC